MERYGTAWEAIGVNKDSKVAKILMTTHCNDDDVARKAITAEVEALGYEVKVVYKTCDVIHSGIIHRR
jgi:hypothetical protein